MGRLALMMAVTLGAAAACDSSRAASPSDAGAAEGAAEKKMRDEALAAAVKEALRDAGISTPPGAGPEGMRLLQAGAEPRRPLRYKFSKGTRVTYVSESTTETD